MQAWRKRVAHVCLVLHEHVHVRDACAAMYVCVRSPYRIVSSIACVQRQRASLKNAVACVMQVQITHASREQRGAIQHA